MKKSRWQYWWRRLWVGKAPSAPIADGRIGHWSDRKIQTYTALVADISGDMAEIGVAYGETFKRLAQIARAQGKIAHAFDSFEGMSTPGQFDRQVGGHTKGQFDVGGVGAFRKLLDDAGVSRSAYRLWPGFIPGGFEAFRGTPNFSLVIVDVDHYTPTRDSLVWVWPRLAKNGIALCDDYSVSWDMESSRAINEFLKGRQDYEILEDSNNQLTLRKTQ